MCPDSTVTWCSTEYEHIPTTAQQPNLDRIRFARTRSTGVPQNMTLSAQARERGATELMSRCQSLDCGKRANVDLGGCPEHL